MDRSLARWLVRTRQRIGLVGGSLAGRRGKLIETPHQRRARKARASTAASHSYPYRVRRIAPSTIIRKQRRRAATIARGTAAGPAAHAIADMVRKTNLIR